MITDPTEPCRDCPLERKCSVPRRDGRQYSTAVVFEHPTNEADLKGDFLAGKRGSGADLLRVTAEAVGLDLEDVYLTSATNCSLSFDKKNESVLKKAMLACKERLVSELRSVGVTKVLCLGTVGYSALVSAERNLPITKVRGRWVKAYGMDVLATFGPGMVSTGPDWFRDFAFDLEKFATEDGRAPWPEVNVERVDSPIELAGLVTDLIEEQDAVSMDLETTGLSPIADEVIALGIGVTDEAGNGTTYVLDDLALKKKTVWKQVARLLNSTQLEVVFHNCKFDLKFLRVAFEERGIPYAPAAVQDTMLLHYALDERPMGRYASHRLETLARCRFDAPDYSIDIPKFLKEWNSKGLKKVRRDEMREDLRTYLALDCYYTARLYPLLYNEALEEDEALLDLFDDTLMPAALALADIELRGVEVDTEFYEAAEIELNARAEEILGRLRTASGNPEFNPNSPKQVKALVYGEDGLNLPYGEEAMKAYKKNQHDQLNSGQRAADRHKAPTFTSRRGVQREGPTAKAVLKTLAREFPDHHAVLDDIVQYRNLVKNTGTYVRGMLDRVDPDGRIRGNFNPHGTATGRLSSDNPNLQNIPDASHTGVEVRNGFVAGEGNVFIEADYSQLELRVAALIAEDPVFKQVFIDDRDVHQEVTWALFGKTREEATKYERYMAKCMNFGVMYARGARSLAEGPEMDYIADSGGTPWSVEEVTEFFDKMLRNWARFNEWMGEQKEFAYREQYVQGPFGNKRRFDYIPPTDGGAVGRQAVNTPIQGTASHITLSALVRIHHRLPGGAYIVSTVHDSILIQTPRALVNEVLVIVKEEMEDNVPLPSDVPFKSDADVAERWGEMTKWSWDPDNLVLIAADD